MNATDGPPNPGGMFDAPKVGGFGYGIGVSVGILLLITTITLASYFCSRNNNQLPASPAAARDDVRSEDVELGIDEATLTAYPKLIYSQSHSQTKADKEEEAAASCCAICLADYKDADVLRLLPDCKHLFHLKCVDPWLRRHPTCPVCRTSPMPSPLPTPLAEVVPLARQQP